MASIEHEIQQRILILDGSMGVLLQSKGFTEEDYRGERFKDHPSDVKNNTDLLNLTQPASVKAAHASYLEAGADILETNTFNANAIAQADFAMTAVVRDMNIAGARLALEAVREYREKNPTSSPRFVAGALGPCTRSASVVVDADRPAYRNVTFDELRDAYYEQAKALIEGGVDFLLVETTFDTLNLKAALVAIQQLFAEGGRQVPLSASLTITDIAGGNLSGQNLAAMWHSIRHAPLFSVGLNCALGPKEMRPFIAELSHSAETFVSAYPNAGLPDPLSATGFPETPESLAPQLKEWAEQGYLNIVGGCCGTTPAHIRAIAEAVKGLPPRPVPKLEPWMRLSGTEPFTLRPETNFVNIGERCNVAGSPKFAKLVREGKFEEALTVARQQVEGGAQVLDICFDDGMLDGQTCMTHFLNLIQAEPDIHRVPLMVDSSKWEIIEAGLKCCVGKPIVNSISLKEGEEKFIAQAKKVREYGAAVVVMAFDEEGQADTFARKTAVCERHYKILTEQVGFPPEDIIFDPNVLTVGTGIEQHNNYAVDFIEATRWIKQNLPHAKVSGGISNVSFSFRGNNPVREAMHAAFLYHAIKAGLDMGIVNPAQLAVYDEVPKDLLEHVEDVLLNRRPDATERLLTFAESVKGNGKKETPKTEQVIRPYVRVALEEARKEAERSTVSPTGTGEDDPIPWWDKIAEVELALGHKMEASTILLNEINRLTRWYMEYPEGRWRVIFRLLDLAPIIIETGLTDTVATFITEEQERLQSEPPGRDRDWVLEFSVQLLTRLNCFEQAAKSLELIASLDDRDQQVVNIAIRHAELGDYDRAIPLIRGVSEDYKRGLGLIRLALVLLEAGHREQAQALLPEIVSLENASLQIEGVQNSHSLNPNIGGLFAKLGDISNMRKYLPDSPYGSQEDCEVVALALAQISQFEEAHAVIKQMRTPSERLEARLLLLEGRTEEAKALLSKHLTELQASEKTFGWKLIEAKSLAQLFAEVGMSMEAEKAFELCYQLLWMFREASKQIPYFAVQEEYDWEWVAADLVLAQIKAGLAFEEVPIVAPQDMWRSGMVEERLAHALLKGVTDYIEVDTEEGTAEVRQTASCHRRPPDGWNEHRRRPLRCRQNVPATGRQIRPCHEAIRRRPDALHGSRKSPAR